MTTQEDDNNFQDQMRDVLRASEHDLDPEVLQRLDTIRRAAVAEAELAQTKLWQRPMVWGMGGSVAAAALVFAVFVGSGASELPPLDQPDFVVAQDAELLEELEFVAWMMAMEESGEAPVSS